MQKLFTISFLLLLIFKNSFAQIPTVTLTQWPNATTSFSNPVLVTNCGDKRKFVVQRTGAIYIVDSTGTKLTTPFLNVASKITSTNNEQGLLCMAFDPDYLTNGEFYIYYTANNPVSGSGDNTLARYKVSSGDPNVADPTSAKVLFHITDPYWNHNGSNLVFGPDGYLYISMGDGGSGGDPGNRGQNKKQWLGKIHRINVHDTLYTIPSTNPFFGDTTYNQTIWDLGLRNPWRCNFDKITGDFWIADVGQNAWEEIDFEPAGFSGGANYGWRCFEGINHTYNSAGCSAASAYDPPIADYAHSGGACSITGGYVYRGTQFHDMWGRYFYIDYCSGKMSSIIPNGSGGWTTDVIGTFTQNVFGSFGTDNMGELYLCGHDNNKVYKMTSADCHPVGYIMEQDTVNFCNNESLHALVGDFLTYQWLMNGTIISGATIDTYTPTTSGNYSVIVTKGACADTSTITYVNFCVGVNNFNVVSKAKIFPNPNNGQFNLSISLLKSQNISVEIFNSLGQIISEKNISLPEGISTIPLQLNNPSRGVYHFTIKGNQSVMNGSFVVE